MSAPPAPVPPAPPARAASRQAVRTTGPEVVGDGTTARTRAAARWRRWRLVLVVAVVVVVAGLLASLITPRTSDLPLAPDNPRPSGARAAAQILGREGVDVRYVRTSAEALAAAGPGTTLLVTTTHLLTPDQVADLAAVEADVVLLEPTWDAVEAVTDGRLETGRGWAGDARLDAACEDPDARAAGTIRAGGGGFTAVGDDVVVCFPLADDPTTGAYAVVHDGDRRVVAIGDASVVTNERLTEEGHAALTLRTLGHHPTLVWYAPSYADTGGLGTGPSAGELLPDWAGPLALQLAVVTLALALWRGRAFGRIVTEPLPVTVRAAEAVRGRGRLYRRTRSRGHAAAALRAGTARRTAARLGLPRSAGAPEVIDALSRATGRDGREVAALLYGPPPTDDAGLMELARRLDELESEVHRS